MPARTAFLITIGDVIESGPPQTRSSTTDSNRNTKRQRNSSSNRSTNGVHSNGNNNEESELSDLSDEEIATNGHAKKSSMKTRHISASSSSSMTNGNSIAQPIRKGKRVLHDEDDDEVSFSDSAFEVNGVNGTSKDEVLPPGPACSKRKRKSLTEKFLEDNASYYGLQVLPNKLRNHSVVSSSFSDDLQAVTVANDSCATEGAGDSGQGRHKKKSESSDCPPASPLTNGRSRNNSISVISSKRQRLTSNCSSTNEDDKRLRINIRKIDEKSLQAALSGTSSGPDDDDEVVPRRTRKAAAAAASSSGANSPGKIRRSELDKLLEAGSSSFHFETAKQTANRLGLGPIHIDVKSTDSSDEEEPKVSNKKKPMPASKKAAALEKRNQRLLKKVSPAPPPKDAPPVKKRLGRPPKKVIPVESDEDEEDEEEEDLADYLSEAVRKSLDDKLDAVDGAETNVDAMIFSFEKTPLRESWFETYTRQDQGDEILYYPEPKSFPLPYEMPLSTFYPRKDPNKEPPSSGKWNKRSVNPSGTATPSEGRGTRGSCALALQASQKLTEVVAAKKVKSATALAKIMAAQQADRKSPRCHASTKSLISSVHPSNDDVDVESLDEKKFQMFDEYSNDSSASFVQAKNSKAPVTESQEEIKIIESTLDTFFTESDPMLDGLDNSKSSSPIPPSEDRKLKRQNSDKPYRPHKHKHRSKRLSSRGEHMDYVVAANVDQVLLDCLEDELPSVTFPDEIPGSSPLELIENFHTCTSMRPGQGRVRPTRPFSVNNSRKNSLVVTDDEEDMENSSIVQQNSTILKRLLTEARLKGVDHTPKKIEDYSSSEDTNSVSSSTTNSSTSSTRKKKRKRNLTGFPNPKKKKVSSVKSQKLLTTVLKQNLKKKNSFAKDRIQQAKKVIAKKQSKAAAGSPRRKMILKKVEKRGRKRKNLDAELAEDEISVTDTDTERVVAKKPLKKSPKVSIKTKKSKRWESDSEDEVLPVSTKRGKSKKPVSLSIPKKSAKKGSSVRKPKPKFESDSEDDLTDGDQDSEPEVIPVRKAKQPKCKRALRTRKQRPLKKARKS